MKHINLTDDWKFSTEPFDAFRCEIVFGRNKRDRQMIPTKVNPGVKQKITSGSSWSNDFVVHYEGFDQKEADEVFSKASKNGASYLKREKELPTLFEDEFKVIKTREKGTIMIVPGVDTTDRCLLMVGCSGGFRGYASLVDDATDAQILKKCQASSACDSRIAIIAMLDREQSVVFHSTGRRNNNLVQYTWNGNEIEKKIYTASEWKAKKDVEISLNDEGEVETL
jgi:hypothetical protein